MSAQIEQLRSSVESLCADYNIILYGFRGQTPEFLASHLLAAFGRPKLDPRGEDSGLMGLVNKYVEKI